MNGHRFVERTLANGLRMAVEVLPTAKSVTIGVWVKTGSRDETPRVMGVSHFLEHMMFKGTPTISASDLNLAFDRMGTIVNNASTNYDVTTYFAKVTPEFTQPTLTLLTDMMRPALRTEDFTVEKNVILEEIALYLDRPMFEVMVQAQARYFGDHPLAYPILGTPESIRAMSADEMRGYWTARYVPSNMIVMAVGAVDPEAFFAMTERACGAWQGPVSRRTFPPIRPKTQGMHVLTKPQFARQHLLFLAPSPPRTREWEDSSSVWTAVIGDDQHSRLYWELIETGLADSAIMEEEAFEDCGVRMVYVSCDPARAAEIARKVFTVIRTPAPPTDQELEMAKNKQMSAVVLEAERGVGRYYGLGGDLVAGMPYRTVEERAGAIGAVTRADIEKLLAAYPMNDWAVTTVGPLEKLEV